MWFWVDFFAQNTSILFVTGWFSSILAVGFTCLFTRSSPRESSGQIPDNDADVADTFSDSVGEEHRMRRAGGADVCFEATNVVKRSFSKAVNSEEELSDFERQEEQKAVRRQLEEIYKLMRSKEEKYGEVTLEQMQDQLRFYKE